MMTLLDLLEDNPLKDAEAWREENRTAYAQIVEWAEWDQAHGHRPSIDMYVNLLRRPHFTRLLGVKPLDRVFLVNNTLRAQIARLIVSEHPHLRFELRRSKSDR